MKKRRFFSNMTYSIYQWNSFSCMCGYIHRHSYVFIKCYLIPSEKACLLGFIWKLTTVWSCFNLENAERTFRKYFTVLCKPHLLERLYDEFNSSLQTHLEADKFVPHSSPTVFPIAKQYRQTTLNTGLRHHRTCSHMSLMFSTHLSITHWFSPGTSNSTIYIHDAQAMKRCE